MGGIYRNADGKERYVHDDEHASATAAGYAPRDSQNLVNRHGNVISLSGEQVASVNDQRLSPGLSDAPDEQVAGLVHARDLDTAYGGFTGGAEAFGLGAARGATFGLSDLLVDPEVAARYEEAHGGLSLAGNIGGGAALSLLTGGLGTAGIAAKGLGGAAGAGVLEGMAFGVGQANSALILRNEPLTAESIITEYGTDIFLGGAFGGLGGAAGHGLEKLGGKLFGRGTARLAKDPEEVLAANALEAGAVPLDSARGRVLTEDFTSGVGNATTIGDEIAAEVAKRPVIAEAVDSPTGPAKTIGELPDEMFTGEGALSGRNAIQFVEDAADEAVMSAEGLGRKELVSEVRGVRNARRDLSKLINAEGNPNAQTVGTGATKGANLFGETAPADIKAAFSKLHDRTVSLATKLDDPGILDNLNLGQKLPDGTRKGGLQQFFDESATVSALPKPGSLEPAVKEAATAYSRANGTLRELLYVRDGKLASKRTLAVLGELPPPEAMRVAQAYSDMIKNAKTMGQALGPEWTAKAQLLDQELAKVTKAVRSLVTPESAAASPGITAAEMITTLGIMEAPDLDGPADDMAKLWLVSAMLKGKFKGAGAGEAAASGGSGFAGKLKNWTQNTGGRIATRSVGWGGNPIVSGIKAGVASTGARWTLGKIMGQTQQLAAVTAKAGARSEQAVGKLLQGTGKAVRRAAPFAPNALLKSVRFADIDHPKGTSEFEKRAREIRMNVANSYGVQRTVLNNLGPDVATHYPGIADKTVAQADRTMKFLSQKLPRDPGTVTALGRSRWKASEQDISKFARFMRAALDPDGELDRIAEGSMSVEGAETLRLLYPAKFAKFQEHIAANLPALQDKLSYAQQVNLSVLFDVPVTSCMEPSAIKAFQATFAADASSQPVSQPPPGATTSTPLSPAQELLTR